MRSNTNIYNYKFGQTSDSNLWSQYEHDSGKIEQKYVSFPGNT